jgi:hypothetical protein
MKLRFTKINYYPQYNNMLIKIKKVNYYAKIK